MGALNVMMLGAIAMANVVAGMFFLRFWRQSRDRFFLLLATSFFVETVNRVGLALQPNPSDGVPVLYCVRLLAYVLILVAIADKNRSAVVANTEPVATIDVTDSAVRH